MWLTVLISSVPSLVLLVLLIFTRKNIHRLEKGQLALLEERERREKELAALEAEQARLKSQISQFNQTLALFRQNMDEIEGRSIEDCTAIRKNMEALFKKIEQLQPGISSESARELLDSPLVAEVLSLLEQGESPVEIARRKGIQVGEITLIKSLKKFSPKARP